MGRGPHRSAVAPRLDALAARPSGWTSSSRRPPPSPVPTLRPSSAPVSGNRRPPAKPALSSGLPAIVATSRPSGRSVHTAAGRDQSRWNLLGARAWRRRSPSPSWGTGSPRPARQSGAARSPCRLPPVARRQSSAVLVGRRSRRAPALVDGPGVETRSRAAIRHTPPSPRRRPAWLAPRAPPPAHRGSSEKWTLTTATSLEHRTADEPPEGPPPHRARRRLCPGRRRRNGSTGKPESRGGRLHRARCHWSLPAPACVGLGVTTPRRSWRLCRASRGATALWCPHIDQAGEAGDGKHLRLSSSAHKGEPPSARSLRTASAAPAWPRLPLLGARTSQSSACVEVIGSSCWQQMFGNDSSASIETSLPSRS